MRNKYYLIIVGGILLATIFIVKIYKEEIEMKQDINEVFSISDFQDMNFYILCDTSLNAEITDIEHTYGIYGKDADDVDKGEKLYQECKAAFFANTYSGRIDDSIVYISPDCEWVIVERAYGKNEQGEALRQQTLYYKGDMQRQVVSTYSRISPITVINDEFEHKEIGEQLYQNFAKLNNMCYEKGYYGGLLINEHGNLAVGIKEESNERLDIWNIEAQEIIWSLALTDIQDKVWSKVIQFYGNDRGGQIIIQSGRKFYEISYPISDVKLLGEDMYFMSYSPDMKYIVYSGINNEAGMELEQDEIAGLLSGIFVKEIKTGKTAYIECNYEWWQLNERNFYWIDEDAMHQYLKK